MHLCCGSVSKPRETRGCRGPAQKKEERPKCLHMFQASSHLLASIINAAHHTLLLLLNSSDFHVAIASGRARPALPFVANNRVSYSLSSSFPSQHFLSCSTFLLRIYVALVFSLLSLWPFETSLEAPTANEVKRRKEEEALNHSPLANEIAAPFSSTSST